MIFFLPMDTNCTFFEKRDRSGISMVCIRDPLDAIRISTVFAVNARM